MPAASRVPVSRDRSLAARVIPFAAFMAFIGAGELLRLLPAQALPLPGPLEAWLYPPRVLAAVLLLFHYRREYSELRLSDLRAVPVSVAVLSGLAVYFLWVRMDWPWAVMGQAQGFDPAAIADPTARAAFLTVRIVGAVAVVPVMEELFWRSFLPRYLASRNFADIAPGVFTPFSFAASALLFGLEHNMYLAGVMAGIAYNLLFWRTRSLAVCVLSHAVTNAALAAHVLATGSWRFW